MHLFGFPRKADQRRRYGAEAYLASRRRVSRSPRFEYEAGVEAGELTRPRVEERSARLDSSTKRESRRASLRLPADPSLVALAKWEASAKAGDPRGFTLLELLIVISIIVILLLVIILALNHAESIKKSRDAARLADLNALTTAIAIYATTVDPVDLDAAFSGICLDSAGGNTTAKISYSFAQSSDPTCGNNVAEGIDVNTANTTFDSTDACRYVVSTTLTNTNGTGWLPVNFGSIIGGSPIRSLPIDPSNTVGTVASPDSGDFVYRYACQHDGGSGNPSSVFEINAQLESDTYGPNGKDLEAIDGGDNTAYFETGTSVFLIGGGTNF